MQNPETAALPAVPWEPSGAAGCGRGVVTGRRENAEHPDRQLVRQQQQTAGVDLVSLVVIVRNKTSRISSMSVVCIYHGKREDSRSEKEPVLSEEVPNHNSSRTKASFRALRDTGLCGNPAACPFKVAWPVCFITDVA